MAKKKYTVGSVALSTIGSAVLAIILVSLVVFSFGSFTTAPAWLFIVQVIALLIYMGMIYSPSWYCGDHDSNAVQFGRMKEDPIKGLRIGLVAMIPFALTPIILILSKLNVFDLDLGFIYRILNVHMLYAINFLLPPDQTIAQASWPAIAGVWLYHLITPVVTFAAYKLGYHHISISERLIFKNLPKNSKKKRP